VRERVAGANLALLLVLVVLSAAVLGGRLVAVTVAVATALAFDFFLTKPYESFAIARADDTVTAVLLVLVGLVGGELVERTRRSEREAQMRRTQLERLRRRAELAAGGESHSRLIAQTAREIATVLGATDVTFQPGPARATMASLTHRGAHIPAGTAGTVNHVALAVRAHGRDLGHFDITLPTASAGMSASSDQRHMAVALADQLGMALLRYDRPT
jgi:K+-sensing histidine kinase KdpD